MRYKRTIYIARRTGSTQAAKGDIKAEYAVPEAVTAAVYPIKNAQESMPYGFKPEDMRKAYTKASAKAGDGVFLHQPTNGEKPDYIVQDTQEWPCHNEWIISKAK